MIGELDALALEERTKRTQTLHVHQGDPSQRWDLRAFSEHVDPVEIRQLYPDLILWGGIDERAVLTHSTPEEVGKEAKRVIRGVERGPILGSTGGVHAACPVENLIAMIEAVHDVTS